MPRQQTEERFQIGEYWLSKREGSDQWCRTWYDAGSRQTRRASLRTADFEQATVKLAEWYLAHNRPKNAAPAEILLPTVLDDYVDVAMAGKPSANQAEIARKHLKAFFGPCPLSEITIQRQEEYVKARRAAGRSDGTISRELSVLRAALKRAVKRGELASVPFVMDPETKDDKRQREPKGRPLTMKEVAALFNAAEAPHVRRFLLVLLCTCCRPDAARDLTAFQIDREHDRVNLNPPGRRQTKKYRPIVPLAKALRLALKDVKAGPVVAYSKKGRKVTTLKTAWRALRTRAKLDATVNPYSIRHTMAREMRKRRVPSEEISLMLGHAVPGSETTSIYAPFSPDYCANAVAAINDYCERLSPLLAIPLVGPKVANDERKEA